jgi:hypothetical protein
MWLWHDVASPLWRQLDSITALLPSADAVQAVHAITRIMLAVLSVVPSGAHYY